MVVRATTKGARAKSTNQPNNNNQQPTTNPSLIIIDHQVNRCVMLRHQKGITTHYVLLATRTQLPTKKKQLPQLHPKSDILIL